MIYRLDRNEVGVDRGEGILIAINKSHLVTLDNVENLVFLAVKFKVKTRKFIVSTVYVPRGPASVYLKYSCILDELMCNFPKSNFIHTGDFDLPSV